MLNKMQKNKKYIVLKDGNNYGLMCGVFVLVVICILLFTSKMWLPDSRPNLSTKKGSDMFFTLNELKVNEYNIDYKTSIGEVLLSQKKSSSKGQYDLTYKVYDDKGNELPFFVIDGKEKKESEDSVFVYQDTLLQFGVYEDIYYVKVDVIQKDTTTQSIHIDYRDFKQKKVLEKGKDYLVNLEVEKGILEGLENQLKPYQEKEKTLEKEYKSIIKLKDKGPEEQQKRAYGLREELEVLKSDIKPLVKEIDVQKKKIKELE